MERHQKAITMALVLLVCTIAVFLFLRTERTREMSMNEMLRLPSIKAMEIWAPRSWKEEDVKRYCSARKNEILLVCRIDSSECTSCKIRSLYKLYFLAETLSKENRRPVKLFVYLTIDRKKARIYKRTYYESILSVPVFIDGSDILRKRNEWLYQLGAVNVYVIDGEGNVLKGKKW